MRSRLFSAAAGLAVAAGMLAAQVTPAVAAATHVGIVVRFGGSSLTACASPGGNGLNVLSRKFAVVVGQAAPYVGFVLKINGKGTLRPDTTHYWSYWHSPGNGTWTYSSAGAGSYTPRAGTVEGWSYVNGTSAAPRPPSVTYSALCSKLDPKPIHPKPKPTHPKPKPTHPKPAPAYSRAAPPETATPTADATHASQRAQTPAPPKKHAAKPTTSATVTPAVAGRRTSPASSASAGLVAIGTGSTASSGTIRAAGPPSRHSAAGFPAWGTALALLIVVVLGGVAWLRIRRRPE